MLRFAPSILGIAAITSLPFTVAVASGEVGTARNQVRPQVAANPSKGGMNLGPTSVTTGSRIVEQGAALDAGPNEIALVPRRPLPKRASAVSVSYDPQTNESLATGRIIVKFRDDLRVRAPIAPIDRPVCGTDPVVADQIAVVLAKHGGLIEQWINRTPEQLALLEQRAANQSGRAQPDLAGMMAISFPVPLSEQLLSNVAVEIQSLESVEFAWIELQPRLDQCGPTDQPAQNPNCNRTPAAGGTWCNAPSDSCCDPAVPPWDPSVVTTNIFQCNGGTLGQPLDGNYGCRDVVCCELVSQLNPSCENPGDPAGWDVYCAALANLLCSGTIFDTNPPLSALPLPRRYNPCFTDVSGTEVNPLFAPLIPTLQPGNCFDATPGSKGCGQPLCCYDVCIVDPSCCTQAWDQSCVNVAQNQPRCNPGTNLDVTADFVPLQPYLSDARYTNVPPAPVWNAFPFYGGEGFALEGSVTPLRTLPDLLNDLEQAYGLGPPLPFGKSINVGVIEFSAFVNHEDFVLAEAQPDIPSAVEPAEWQLLAQPKVIPEPGQTLLLIEGANNDPQHGTAALGQIVAAKQERGIPGTPDYRPEIGVRGMAREAQGWFFPIVSVEEGSRPQNAFLSCFELFGPGDVTNNSWGFGGGNTVPSQEPFNVLIRVGTDLGITSVCSAGNSSMCVVSQPAESGAIIVGASSPGRVSSLTGCGGYQACFGQYWRLGFSNITNTDDPEIDPLTGTQLNLVHVSAWGSNVTTTGYGDLAKGAVGTIPPGTPGFPAAPNVLERDQLRSYTAVFSGTSAAAPMISAVVANLQAAAKQAFQGPLTPFQIRNIVSSWGPGQCDQSGTPEADSQCPMSRGNDCCPLAVEGNDCVFNSISNCGVNLYDAGVAVFTSGPANNTTEIKVLTGYTVDGEPPASIFIRAADGSYLRLGTEQMNAGTNIEGLTYLVTGPTTDVYARLQSNLTDPDELSQLGLKLRGRSTATITIVGGFLYNYQSNRWDFIGVDFYGPASQAEEIIMPIPPYALERYFGDDGIFRARVWTCGLGLSGPHQVWHDLIQIGVNDPVFNPPAP